MGAIIALAGFMVVMFALVVPLRLRSVERERAAFIAHCQALGLAPVEIPGSRLAPHHCRGAYKGVPVALGHYRGRPQPSAFALESGTAVFVDSEVGYGARNSIALRGGQARGDEPFVGGPEQTRELLRPLVTPAVIEAVRALPPDVRRIELLPTAGLTPGTPLAAVLEGWDALAVLIVLPLGADEARIVRGISEAASVRDVLQRTAH